MPGVCPRCLREVYFAEEKLALGRVWHKFCFTCKNCARLLDSCTITTHSDEIFCRNCYTKLSSSVTPQQNSSREEQKFPKEIIIQKTLNSSGSDHFSECYCCSLNSPSAGKESEETSPCLTTDSLKRSRFRGGGEQQETIYNYQVNDKYSTRENSNLIATNSGINLCDTLQNPVNDDHRICSQHSASQSTFNRQFRIKVPITRPSSTPTTVVSEVCRKFNSIKRSDNNSYTIQKKSASPRRFINRKQSQQTDDQTDIQFWQHVTKDCVQVDSINKSPQAALRSKNLVRVHNENGYYREKKDEGGDNNDEEPDKESSACECLGGGLDCQRCGRKVYHAELQIASGMPFHSSCFSCFCCRKPLECLTYQENRGEIYCKQCYIRNFGPQGYGYGIGAGVLQTPI